MKKLMAMILAVSALFASVVFPAKAQSEDPSDTYTHTDAQYEDADISLWFDYATEKINDTAVNNTHRESASVYMAKNEIENAQFVLSSVTDKSGLSARITPFSDGNGNTLDADIYIELYQNCDSYGNVPDPIPPLSAYGAFSLTAGKSQAFLVKIKSTAETAAGWYESTLTVENAEGNEIKKTKIYAYVWNFALSEKTECATSVGLDITRLRETSDTTQSQMYVNYYDYLLENRVCAFDLPYSVYSKNAIQYMDNPRVTSFRIDSLSKPNYDGSLAPSAIKRLYSTAFEDHPERFDKGYIFSGVVDAAKPADLEELRTVYDKTVQKYAQYQPSYADKPFWFINTYFNDIDYQKADGTVIDQIEYYNDFVNLWCAKPFAYTTAQESVSVSGAKIMQAQKWDGIYGSFKDRMAAKREAGQKVWWFISWDVDAPYINYFIQTDGVAQRLLFWQQFDNDVQGFLYNFANFWYVEGSDPYKANLTNAADYPNAHGESILVYPGWTYGLNVPVGSLRLEAMRDGIEDYQLFHMLEELKGEGSADKYIDKMTTGVVSYSVSDAEYYNVRKSLGKAVENAVNGIEEPTEPTEPALKGDVNGDGKVNALDAFVLKSMISGLELINDVADIDGDGKVNALDFLTLKKILAGK